MVGGNDDRSLVAVLGQRLSGFPETADEVVHMMRGVEIVVVASSVRPFVSFAEANEHEAGLAALEVICGGVEEEGIQSHAFPELGCVAQEVVEKLWRSDGSLA